LDAGWQSRATREVDTILCNGRITTLDPASPSATAVAIKDGVFATVGSDQEIMSRREPKTAAIDLQGRTVIPGLIDSHAHVIRGGLNYNMELRWDGVVSLAGGLRMLRERAQRTPAPQWGAHSFATNEQMSPEPLLGDRFRPLKSK
jgi:hypothetical protein